MATNETFSPIPFYISPNISLLLDDFIELPDGTTTEHDGNMTSQQSHIILHTSEWLLIGAFVFILAIGVTGNLLVIYAFGYRRRDMRTTTTEWLILFLGTTDLLSTIFNSVLFLYWTGTRHSRWDFGYIGCKILPALGPVLITMSSGVILIFSIDRYVAIGNPFRGQLTLKAASTAFLVNIVLSTMSYAHYIIMIDLKGGLCYSRPASDLEYGIPNCTLILLRLSVFAGVFVTTSALIFSRLQRNEQTPSVRSKSANDFSASFSSSFASSSYSSAFSSALTDSFLSGEGLDSSMRRKAKKSRQSRRIAKILFTRGTIFILLVFPRELFYLVFNMSWITSVQGIALTTWMLHLNSWLKVMHTANCCANVFIYAQMHSRFRRVILNYLYCKKCKCSGKYPLRLVARTRKRTISREENLTLSTTRSKSLPYNDYWIPNFDFEYPIADNVFPTPKCECSLLGVNKNSQMSVVDETKL